jgi:hypothetical protein
MNAQRAAGDRFGFGVVWMRQFEVGRSQGGRRKARWRER